VTSTTTEINETPSTTDASRAPLRERILLVGILIAAALLRFYQLGTASLWFDEAATARVVTAPLGEFFLRFRTTENTPPLHYVILWIWTRVFGASEVSLRMPSVIAGVASVFLLYRLMRLLGGARSALIAALLLAVSSYQIYFSQEARAYELMVCLSLWSCCAFLRLMEENSRRNQILFITSTTLLLYTHLFSVFVIAAENIAYLVAWVRRPRPKLKLSDWLGVQLATAAMFLPFIPVVWAWFSNRSGGFWIKPMTLDEITASYLAYAGSAWLLCLMGLLGICGAMLYRHERTGVALLLSLLILPVVVPVVGSVLGKPLFVARYGIVASPALCALAAWGMDLFKTRGPVMVMTVLLTVLSFLGPPAGQKEDWRDVVSYVEKWAHPGDVVVINRRDASRAYDYYSTRHDVHAKGFWGPFITLGIPMPHNVHVWLVLYDPNVPAGTIINNGNWTVVSQKPFDQIVVYELAGGSTDPFPPGLDQERFNARPVQRERESLE
jgi:uncharacterized membrane protein